MTEQHTKEELSACYCKAICAICGFTTSVPNFDYGIDLMINDVQYNKSLKRHYQTGTNIQVQLKASENIKIEDNFISYNLEVKNYNDLVEENTASPKILLLYWLPKDKNEWLKSDENNLILKNCMWWCSLKGQKISNNKKTIKITIPKNQLFNVESLNMLMDKARKGEDFNEQ